MNIFETSYTEYLTAKKWSGLFLLFGKHLPSSNGCKLVKNGHRFVNSRKYLCFAYSLKQRKFFSSIKRTFSPKQTQNAPKNSCISNFCSKNKKQNFRQASNAVSEIPYNCTKGNISLRFSKYYQPFSRCEFLFSVSFSRYK